MSNRKYTPEHIAFLAENIRGCHFSALTKKFNTRFAMEASVSAVIALTNSYGLHNGIDTRLNGEIQGTQFKKGHIPANKGKKGVGGWEPTQFKKGSMPWNYKPVGTERIDIYGYVCVKVADPKTWRFKHVLIWEAAKGPVPKGSVLIFADKNKLNVSLDNLILVTRGQLVRLNQNHLIQSDPELTRSGVIIADILAKCAERKRKGKQNSRKRTDEHEKV